MPPRLPLPAWRAWRVGADPVAMAWIGTLGLLSAYLLHAGLREVFRLDPAATTALTFRERLAAGVAAAPGTGLSILAGIAASFGGLLHLSLSAAGPRLAARVRGDPVPGPRAAEVLRALRSRTLLGGALETTLAVALGFAAALGATDLARGLRGAAPLLLAAPPAPLLAADGMRRQAGALGAPLSFREALATSGRLPGLVVPSVLGAAVALVPLLALRDPILRWLAAGTPGPLALVYALLLPAAGLAAHGPATVLADRLSQAGPLAVPERAA
ncbi:MAG: hypothetical protein L0216_10835 [Planctomycetales bacterium]|nr:hypothetical protein [Planctomycetales bacterium]